MQQETGVIIESGAQDWQIFQQDRDGAAVIRLKGRWLADEAHRTARVLVRLVDEETYEPVSLALEWRRATTRQDGSWSAVLRDVPRGGLYRLETGLQLNGGPVEWVKRGDMVHHLGVGDLWVIAGQSNSSGYGKSPALDGPELGIHMFHARGTWQLASHPLSDSTQSRYPANREGANGSHSPYLAFARALKRALGYPIGLIPAALGGSPISAWLPSVDGRLFRNMMDYVRDAGGACRGLLWYQGESDTGPDARQLYAGRFAEFVQEARRALRADLPVITAQLNRCVGESQSSTPPDGWDVIREIQRQAARNLAGVHVISTLDLGLSDGIHNHSSANLTIGERMAAVARGAVHGQDVKYLHPDLSTIRRVGKALLELTFDNVDTRLHFENNRLSDFPFGVIDAQGTVPIKAWTIGGGNRLRITTQRAMDGAVTVVGAPTAAPPSIVPFDICGYRPMLGFTVSVD